MDRRSRRAFSPLVWGGRACALFVALNAGVALAQSIGASFEPATVRAGRDVVVDVTVAAGAAARTNVSVTFAQVAGLTPVWGSPGCSLAAAGGKYTCTVGDLAANASARVSMAFLPTAGGSASVAVTAAAASGALGNSAANFSIAAPVAGQKVPRFRLYQPGIQAHLLTTDQNEYNVLATRGWTQEGISHYVYDNPAIVDSKAAIPNYRIYIMPLLRHFWTTDPNEYYTLRGFPGVYQAEGIDGFVFAQQVTGSTSLFRLYHSGIRAHLWTTDQNEFSVLSASGAWKPENLSGLPNGVVGYVFQSGTPPKGFLNTAADAARFLQQTTFGATRNDISALLAGGTEAWLANQFAAPQTSHVSTVRNDPNYPDKPWSVMAPSLWKQYFEGNDQLRQRVVHALSQIIVISMQNNTIQDQACGPAAFMDMLGAHAFGNFRNMLRDTTLSPAMGEYLNLKGSAKADPRLNSIPNENYARELLQLFSLGTVMLNQDGTVQKDGSGKPIPTYGETEVRELSRALSGWNFAAQDQTKPWRWLYPDVPYPDPTEPGSAAKACDAWSTPMQPWTQTYRPADDDYRFDIPGPAHDQGAKVLLSYTGAVKKNLPAGQTPQQDVEDAIDNIFNHPNVGPFIGKQLIQRMVTSNPSSAYVSRVAAAFNNNGAGVRGDMKAVIRAVLLDQEARDITATTNARYGALREPILRFTQLHRAFGAKMQNGYYGSIWDLSGSDNLGQAPLRAPSVFNFYHPDFAPSGPVQQNGMVGPEFEITNSATLAGFADFSKWGVIGGFGQYESDKGKWIKPDYSYFTNLADNPAAMVDEMNLVLMAGSMSAQFRAQLIDAVTKLTDSNAQTQKDERFKMALWLIVHSPEYVIQK